MLCTHRAGRLLVGQLVLHSNGTAVFNLYSPNCSFRANGQRAFAGRLMQIALGGAPAKPILLSDLRIVDAFARTDAVVIEVSRDSVGYGRIDEGIDDGITHPI